TIRQTEVTNHMWEYSDDEGVDVAIVAFDPPDDAEFKAIPISMIADDAIIQEKRIGVADDMIVTALFTKRSGHARNIPVLRAGIISAMPGEPLTGLGGEEYQAYLLEMHSTGGLSGSPVFVVKNLFVDPHNKTPTLVL